MEQNPCKPICERLGEIPPMLWIALGSLVIMTLGKTIQYIAGDPIALLEAVLAGTLLVGIYQKQGWAYWLAFVLLLIDILNSAYFAKHHSQGALLALLAYLPVLIPVLIRRDYFPPLWAAPAYTAKRWSSQPAPLEEKGEKKEEPGPGD